MSRKRAVGVVLVALMALVAANEMAGMSNCNPTTLDFIMLQGDASIATIEDDIRADLAKVGITAVARTMRKDPFNAAKVSGDFDLAFSETWGAPYDPHSYLASWTTPDEAHYAVMENMPDHLNTTTFQTKLASIMTETVQATRQSKYTALLDEIHSEVLHVPLWGKKIPSVVRRSRLSGYAPGNQQFDYPIQNARIVAGSRTVTVAPGAQSGRFSSVGPLHPHSYRPNEFFSNNWVYESLVAYGANGAIEPALATSWDVTADAETGAETVRFTLRTGVTFHDGTVFDCAAVKLNFDHVFAGGLKGPDWHGWYGLPGALAGWSCDSETFVLRAAAPYYPLLQELTYIRPLQMLSPAAFVNGNDTDPVLNNSCPTKWDTVDGIHCSGTTAISGTGPFKFGSRTAHLTIDGSDATVTFVSNANYWKGKPDIDELKLVHYGSAAAVKTALDLGELDAVLGAGVLAPEDVRELSRNPDFDVRHSPPLNNVVIIMNIPDINIRKTVVHAVNKVAIIARELGGNEAPVSQLFPVGAPYCDINLSPRFDFDLEKATLLNCRGRLVSATSCGVTYTSTRTPSRVITMNQGVTEFMLAMGLEGKMVGTAYLDDAIWPRYAAAYARIPVLSSSYPNETTIMDANPDFILGSYKSAFAERRCTPERCRGIFTNETVGPCEGPGSDFFPSGSNETTAYSTCRPQLHAAGIGTWLEPVSCEDSDHKPQGGATEETVYAAIRQIGDIFNIGSVAESLISDIRNDFVIANQTVARIGSALTAVWLDCIDCCDDANQLFVGGGLGAPNLIMREAGLVNAFADKSASWSCVDYSEVVAADPDMIIVVDALWDTALSKIDLLHDYSDDFCNLRAVKKAAYVIVPFSAATLGPRNGVAALDLVSAAVHVTSGDTAINFESGVRYLDPQVLEDRTAQQRCPIRAKDLMYSGDKRPSSSDDDNDNVATTTMTTLGSGDLSPSGDKRPSSSDDDNDNVGLTIAVVLAVIGFAALAFLVIRERIGKAVFQPLENNPEFGEKVPAPNPNPTFLGQSQTDFH